MPPTKDSDRIPGPVAEVLERLMESRGLSARALSERAGGPPDTVRNILRGRSRHPRADTLAGLARVLGVSVGVLTGEEPLPSPARKEQPRGAGPFVDFLEVPEVFFPSPATAPSPAPDPQTTGTSWRFPAALVTEPGRALGAAKLGMIRAPTGLGDVRQGDWLLVDYVQRLPSPPGAFLVWDGVGPVLVRLRIAPDAGKTLRLRMTAGDGVDEVVDYGHPQVLGRVIGRWLMNP